MPYGLAYRIAGSAPIPGDAERTATLYGPGDVVDILETHQIGEPHPGDPHRYLIVTDGVSRAEAQFLMNPIERVAEIRPGNERDSQGRLTRVDTEIRRIEKKRAFNVDEARLPAAILSQLQQGGVAFCTQAELENAVWDKRATLPALVKDRGGVQSVPGGFVRTREGTITERSR
jgi:hypothetical protein